MSSSYIVENIHARLREEIEAQGLSMADAAREMGEKNAQRLRDVVNGRQKLSAEMLSKATLLGIDTSYILTGIRSEGVEYVHDSSSNMDATEQDAAPNYGLIPSLSSRSDQQCDLVSHFCDRLKSERKRLGYNQQVFSQLAGVSKTTQFNYEKGERQPDTTYLAAIAEVGADVSYLITGSRMLSFAEEEKVKEGSAGYAASPDLSSLSIHQCDLVAQLVQELAGKPQSGYSEDAVRKTVMTVQEIMLEERMQLTPEEVADTVINCLQQSARLDRAGINRQLHAVK